MAKKFLTPIQSTVATGTAPFSIASTTAVTNLNADLLDGQHGNYYAAASSLSNYQPLDADLTAIAALSGTSGLLKKTNTNTWTLDTTAYTTNTGTVTSIGVSVPTGLSVSGTPVTTSGTIAISLASGYSIPTTASQTNWDSAYTDRLKWDGGSTGLTASTGRTSLGATTVGSNIFTLSNPSSITFLRVNADNTVSALSAADFRTAIGAGTSSTVGTVTSVAMTVPTGLSVSGSPITSSGTLAVSLASGYEIPTTAALAAKAPLESPTFTGTVSVPGITSSGDLLPSTDNTGVVGNATNTWSNGQFTNLTVDSTLNVRAAIDLADSDQLRLGSSDDAKIWYNGSTNALNIELESTAVSLNITDNGTDRVVITKSTGTISAGTPTASDHLTTKAYVDSVAGGGGLDPFFLGGM
jgi:hypothetical protein